MRKGSPMDLDSNFVSVFFVSLSPSFWKEIDFDLKLMHEMSSFDQKIREFVNLLDVMIYSQCCSLADEKSESSVLDIGAGGGDYDHDQNSDGGGDGGHLSTLIDDVERQIWKGVADDFDLNVGLEAIIELASRFPVISRQQQQRCGPGILYDCVRLRALINRWLMAMGLHYQASVVADGKDLLLLEHVSHFRNNTRATVLDTLRTLKLLHKSTANAEQGKLLHSITTNIQQLLQYCDDTRTFLDVHGIKLKVSLLAKFFE